MHVGDEDSGGGSSNRVRACPYLGMEEDSSSFCQVPSPLHRCYYRMQRDRIDLSHQDRFCLTDNHRNCPWPTIGASPAAKLEDSAFEVRRAAGTMKASIAGSAGPVLAALWAWIVWAAVALARLTARVAKLCWWWLRRNVPRGAPWLWTNTVRLASPLRARAVQPTPAVSSTKLAEVAAVESSPSIASPADAPAQGVRPPEQAAVDVRRQPVGAAPQRAPRGEALEAQDLVNQGVAAMGQGRREKAQELFVRATDIDPSSEQGWRWRAVLAMSVADMRRCLSRVLEINPSNASARSALELLDQPLRTRPVLAGGAVVAADIVARDAPPAAATEPAAGHTAAQVPPASSLRRAPVTWRCAGCETINAGPSRACRTCGRPSPEVEEELAGSGNLFLAQGLACLKEPDEDMAHAYFVMACEAAPESELAWYWRAKTAPTLEVVIESLEHLLALSPSNPKVQADLAWARERLQNELSLPSSGAAQSVDTQAKPSRRISLRRLPWRLRWWLLQVAGVCAFVAALALAVPYGARFVDALSLPGVGDYLKLLPGVLLPAWPVQAPYLPSFDAGAALPLALGVLLLHAAFLVVDGGGLAARIWTAILGGTAAWMLLYFGTNPPFSTYAAAVAAVAALAALLGGTPAVSKPRTWESRAAGDW